MRTDFRTTRYVHGQLTGGPARDYACSVGIRVGGVPARHTTECRWIGPVALIDEAAGGALPAGVARVHCDQRDARKDRLVLQECAQLRKGPTVENLWLLPPSPYPVANASQFLDGNTASGAFSGSNDLLTDYMVYVAGEPRLFARQFLQTALGGARLFLLQLRPQAAIPQADALQFSPSIDSSIAVGRDPGYAKVTTRKLSDSGLRRIRHSARRHQIPLATDGSQIGFARPVQELGALAFPANERDFQSAIERPYRDRGRRRIPGQNAVVVCGSACRAKCRLARLMVC
jgi:hypothetical protein